MKRYTGFQKLISMVLSLVLIMAMIPTYAAAAQTRSVPVDSRVSDPNTMNQWEDYFGPNMISTEFAGGVWTDKSVLTNASDFRANITLDDPDNHFLVALSALAANQQIVGYTSAPIDVMLVLDVSGSMQGSKATAMVQATNETIDSLLKQNNNNRVGVVLYSGNSSTSQNAGTNTATVILPLDRYTTSSTQTVTSNGVQKTIPAYFTISGNTVSVASTVRNSDGRISGSKSVSGGTYIQNGLYKAWGEFSAVTDVKVPEGQPQAGAQRTPILVLMSDGQPTLATANYTNIGYSQSTYGDGSESSTSWRTVFLTQLTASWVKGKMQAKYGTTPKFYTLGLGTGSSDYATAVLQPSTTYETLDGYWDNFFDSSKLDNNNNVEIIPNTNNWWENSNAWSVYKDSAVKEQNYSNMYKLASDTDELIKAFQQVVENIELDAAGYVTLVEAAGEDYSGYITFTDELGMFMEVKDVKGLVLGDTLFTGHELAKSLQESTMGTQQNPTAYGDEFIATVRERLGIEDVSTAQNLVIAAYNDGQLAYDAATDAYSNYIGWYSDDDGTYLGFWDKDTGITAEGAPEGATWINKSYGYLGTAGNSDMMHVVVMISTHIESGMQVIQYKIPASLIPMVTYEIELNGSDPTDMKSISRKEAFPLRLVYEVGLVDQVNSVNVEQKLNEAVEAGWGHAHKESDGSYAFYTNLWGAEHGDSNVDYNDPMNHRVAQSHFHPADGNDRYYYTVDTPVYVKSGDSYTMYTGTAAPSGSGYYRAHHFYTSSGYTTEYLPMSDYALDQAASMGRQEDGYWYIPQGSVFQQIDRFKMLKEQNTTGTLEYFDYPVVVDLGDRYDTYAFLGNNGKITLKPAQGIQLTKTVTETVEGAQDSFIFDITLSQAVAEPMVTDTDGQPVTGWSVDGNVITVTLKAGQTVCVTGIPTGVTYTVTERDHDDYIGSSDNATGIVKAGTISPVDFVNIPKGYGNLIVSKDVDHPFVIAPDALGNKEFSITVTLSGKDVANETFQVTGGNVTSVTTNAAGAFTVSLKDNESLTVVGLPEGTTFTTTETLDATEHAGFTMDANRSTLSGTIVKDTTVQTHVVNVYDPKPVSTVIHVTGTKTLTDETGAFTWGNESFTIRLEQYDAETGTYTTLAERQVTGSSLSYAFEDVIRPDALGTYYYKVSEVIPAERMEGMSYDATVGRFEVIVTDEDVDGQLELSVYDFDTKQPIQPVNDTITYTKNFENIYTTDPGFVEFTVEKNVVDPHNTGISEAGFLFALYEVVDGVVQTTPAYSMRTVLVNGQGQATFHIPVTKVGSRTFILKENIPADADKIPGMVYDDSQYTVVVTGTAQDNKLVADLSVEGDKELVFTNTMDLEHAELKLGVDKTLIGREPLSDTEFTFQVQETDGSFSTPKQNGFTDTVDLGKGQAFFDPIYFHAVGTYYYRVTEVAGTNQGIAYDNTIYHVTVTVTVENGELTPAVSYVKVGGTAEDNKGIFAFTNTYAHNDTVDVTISGTKTLTGRPMQAGEFRFLLTQVDASGAAVENGLVLEAKNGLATDQSASFSFNAITYDTVGTYYYRVTEIKGSTDEGVTYSEDSYIVTVTVTDNGLGELVASQKVEGDKNVVFANSYKPQGVSTEIIGTKELIGKVLTDGQFSFRIIETQADFQTALDTVNTVVKNDGSGAVKFPTLSYTQEGKHYYLIREEIPQGNTDGIVYDTTEYRVTVNVVDNQKGKLEVSTAIRMKLDNGSVHSASAIVFSNRYNITGKAFVDLSGNKTLTGKTLEDGQFTFELYKTDENYTISGEPIQTQVNTNGAYAMKLEYAPEDVGNTYYYVLVEKNHGQTIEGITYDSKQYQLQVQVLDDGVGGIQTVVTMDGQNYTSENNVTALEDLDFTNTYGTKPVDFIPNATKLYDGKEMLTFTFTLEGHGPKQETTNDSNGKVTFEALTFDAVGDYEVTIRESITTIWDFIQWDTNVYTLKINVEDDGKGALYIHSIQVSSENGRDDLVFDNKYLIDAATYTLSATKIYNKTLAGGEFTFTLTGNGETQTKTNGADGSITFDTLTFDAEGTYTYEVRETTGDKNYITYDSTVYTVEIIVEDDGKGQLVVTSVTVNDVADAAISFTNTYTADPVDYTLSATKIYNKPLAGGEFTFTLTGNGETQTKTNDADGSITFDTLTFDAEGTYTYEVRETKGDKNYITYDLTVYTVVINVEDDGKGQLVVTSVTVNDVADAAISFTNTYTADPVDYTLSATKIYNKPLAGGEFTFTLTGNGETQTKTNGADGSITFDTLTFDTEGTYTYQVKETKGDKDYITYDSTVYTVVIKVEDDGKGQLEVASVKVNDVTDGAITFTNTYTADPVDYTLSATKIYNKPLAGGEFTFTLTGEGVAQTKTNGVDGSITFDALTFDTEGTYTYEVKETKGDKGYITYDSTVYTVVITVADDLQGKLFVQNVTVEDDNDSMAALIFENLYEVTGEPVFSIQGQKELTGRDLVNGEFTFILTDSDGNTKETTNVGGTFSFNNVALPGLGEYVFTITEKNTGVPTITYDKTVYTVTVTVSDDNEGGMVVSAPVVTVDQQAAELVFTNVYTEPDPIVVEFGIEKTVTGGKLSPENFAFEWVYQGQVLETVKTDANGKASFRLECPVESVGTYQFTIREVDTKVANVIYDKTQYAVELTILENAQGKLEATVKVNGVETENVLLKFTNKYDPPSTPQTGDDANVAILMGAMVFGMLGIVTMLYVLVMDRKKSKFER